ncbi:hypothetical protein BD626DRAFT_543792, partial [Schizophyllum amplum]
ELVEACQEQEDRWKKAADTIVGLKKTRELWADIYADMFDGIGNTEERVEEAWRAEGVYKKAAGRAKGKENKWMDIESEDVQTWTQARRAEHFTGMGRELRG